MKITKLEATRTRRSKRCFSLPHRFSVSKRNDVTQCFEKWFIHRIWPAKTFCHYFSSICTVQVAPNLCSAKILNEEERKKMYRGLTYWVPNSLPTGYHREELQRGLCCKEHTPRTRVVNTYDRGGKQTLKQEQTLNVMVYNRSPSKLPLGQVKRHDFAPKGETSLGKGRKNVTWNTSICEYSAREKHFGRLSFHVQ